MMNNKEKKDNSDAKKKLLDLKIHVSVEQWRVLAQLVRFSRPPCIYFIFQDVFLVPIKILCEEYLSKKKN